LFVVVDGTLPVGDRFKGGVAVLDSAPDGRRASHPGTTKDAILARARAIGLDAAAVTRAWLPEDTRRDLNLFLDQGRHADMAWMETTRNRRGDPRVLWPEAASILTLGLNYGPGAMDPLAPLALRDRGVISVYSRNRDYHDIVKSRLKALARWIHDSTGAEVKVFVDTAPVMEKPLAARAGLGWAGKHTNLVSRDYGSWLVLGEVFTTLDLEPDPPHADLCGSCQRCLEACPTGAIRVDAPRRIDARLCVSYLTIEHKGPIPRTLRSRMGNRIYGCDDCVAVCPWNRFAVTTPHDGLLPRAELTAPRLADLAGLDDAGFRSVFAGSPLKRTGRDRFVRNVLIALGNSDRPDLLGAVYPRLDDSAPVVRGAAVWALRRLETDPERVADQRARREAVESDPDVRAEWWGPVCGGAGRDDDAAQ
jgi:epoxyqueuosine reductase